MNKILIILFTLLCLCNNSYAQQIGTEYFLTYCFKSSVTNPSPITDFAIQLNGDIPTVVLWNLSIPQPTIEQLQSLSNEVSSTMVILNEIRDKSKQDAKSITLKQTENSFLIICDQLSGTTNKVKLGFAELEDKINKLVETDPLNGMKISIKLLSIDASGKREGGILWWDDCVWHNDL